MTQEDNRFKFAMMEQKPELLKNCISEERIRHMHGVAELMYKYYDVFSCGILSRSEVYILGLNHDIGYIAGKDGHEFRGANLFSGICEFGKENFIVKCIFHHGNTPKQYMECYMCSEYDIPRELILLWWADLNVESAGEHAGEIVGFKGRLDGLKERYGEDSKPYQICKETIEWLISYISKGFVKL